MKKILFSMTLVCSVWLAGCVVTNTASNSTHKYLNIDVDVSPAPIIADLVVSDQKVSGEALGLAGDINLLRREATAKALRQDPPNAEGPDILVGYEEHTANANGMVKIVVTGYPAWYRNFRKAPDDAPESTWLIITGHNDLQTAEGE